MRTSLLALLLAGSALAAPVPKEVAYKGICEIDGAEIEVVYTLSGERPTDSKAGPGKYDNLLRRVEKK